VKEDEAKASHAALETLHLDMENLASAKEDLDAQLRDKDARLTEAQNEMSRLNSVLERYRAEHIRSAEALRSEVLELLGQCNLDAPPTSFPVHRRGVLRVGKRLLRPHHPEYQDLR
jgi:chromosome segregation ATPase